MSSIVTEIIAILTAGITGLGQGIGAGIQTTVSSMFLDTTGTSPVLSVFGGIVAVFAGLALAVGITRRLFNFLISLGGRR